MYALNLSFISSISSLQLNNAGYLMHGGGSHDNIGGSFIMKSGTVKAEGAEINN